MSRYFMMIFLVLPAIFEPVAANGVGYNPGIEGGNAHLYEGAISTKMVADEFVELNFADMTASVNYYLQNPHNDPITFNLAYPLYVQTLYKTSSGAEACGSKTDHTDSDPDFDISASINGSPVRVQIRSRAKVQFADV